MSARVKFVPVTGLDPHNEGEMWLATAPGPIFQIQPARLPLVPGWYRLRLRMRRVSADSDARLYVYPSDGSTPLEMRLPIGLNGKLDHVFRLPFSVKSLELRPFAGQGAVQLDRGRLYALSAPARVLLMLARIAVFFYREGNSEEMRRLLELPVSPDVTIARDGSPLECWYRTIKRRMVLRSLFSGDYGLWIRVNEHKPSAPAPASKCSLSLILPLGRDPRNAHLSLESVRRQNLQRFECLLVHSPENRGQALDLCREYPMARAVLARGNDGTTLLSDALGEAVGEHVLCLLPGDQLAATALDSYSCALQHRPQLDLLYSDEDRLGAGGRREHPLFKPDWDPELMLGFNYLGPSYVIRRSLAAQHLPRLSMSIPAALFHIALWATHQAGDERIGHLASILLHRRSQEFSLPIAEEKLTVARQFCETHRPGFRGQHADVPGLRHFHPPEPETWPLVSVIIPTRNGAEVLRPCLETLLNRTDYPEIDIIVADNGTTDPTTLELLRDYEERDAIRVIRLDIPFNYSRLNNICVTAARGEVLVFMNNDVEVVRQGWLKSMTSQALRPGIGAVGALLLYPNGLVQHAGIVLGLGGLAGHPRKGATMEDRGSWIPLGCTRSVQAVTGACLAVRRSVFESLNGFEEQLAVAYNDVDFCMRVAQSGLKNILTPQALLLHKESHTRGSDRGKKQSKRLRKEKAFMLRRWGRALSSDRYYNENLTMDLEDCGLALMDFARSAASPLGVRRKGQR